jgi:spore coat polysaccharide biosynthesis protein SpsF (cytidylyltransferase family)
MEPQMNLAVIQARMGSTRLPSKVLMKLGDKTILEHVVSRVRESKFINEVIVATTIANQDLQIIEFCASKQIRVFVGSEQDVLDRYYQASRLLKPMNVIRITSDCPMIDPEIIDLIGQRHINEKADYTSNTIEETFPDGLDAEVFKFDALEQAWREAKLFSEREHVTPYIKKHHELFKLVSVRNDKDLSFMRWTIDQSEDFTFLNEIFKRLYVKKPNFRTNDILNEINQYPELLKINGDIIRNEGYFKSLMKD